ncbi:MAG: HAD family hydrolase [Candidatus Gallimonas sp.]
MIRAVLFDLDGTLLDTLSDIHGVLIDTLRRFGYPEITVEQTREYIGEGARRLIERALPDGADNTDECFAYFKERYAASGNAHTRLFDGEAEFLERLFARGIKAAIVTNKPQAATETVVAQFFPNLPFGFVGGDSGNFPCKPDPTLARFAALTMRVPIEECAFVGDGETDVQTAIAAGMQGVACLWGYRSRERLSEAGATRFASDFAELEKILGEL